MLSMPAGFLSTAIVVMVGLGILEICAFNHIKIKSSLADIRFNQWTDIITQNKETDSK